MKNTEFQFNDLVKYGCGDYQYCAHKIKGIIEHSVHFADDVVYGWFAIDRVNPISINAKILEKNGFCFYDNKKMTNIKVYSYNSDNIFIYYDFLSPICRIITNTGCENETTFDMPKPYFVHELQHILRMFGLNDLADNFKV